MLVENYDLEVFTPPCDPDTERYAARACLTVDISEVLPYLNATLHGAVYFPSAVALTWKKAGIIWPSTPMAIYKLLPNTNCKGCGEPTCYTFALKLAASQRKINDCPPLSEPAYAKMRTALEAMVVDAPAIGFTG